MEETNKFNANHRDTNLLLKVINDVVEQLFAVVGTVNCFEVLCRLKVKFYESRSSLFDFVNTGWRESSQTNSNLFIFYVLFFFNVKIFFILKIRTITKLSHIYCSM